MSTHSHRPDGAARRFAWRSLTAVIGAAALVAGAGLMLAPVAGANGSPEPLNTASTAYDQSENIPICHRTAADNNPYVSESPDFDSISKTNGHDSHEGPIWSLGMQEDKTEWGDIIPAFYYVKNDVAGYYPGKNWTAAGKTIWDNDCEPEGTPPSDVDVTLGKTWVRPVAGSDAVTLTINGSATGVSHATAKGGDHPATITVVEGSTVTLAEEFTSGDAGTYTTTLQCTVDGGAAASVPVSALAGSFVIPAHASTVNCTFVNTAAAGSSTVTVSKSWGPGADVGDSVRLAVHNTTTDAWGTQGTSTVGGTSSPSSVAVFPGDTFTIGETALGETNLSHYTSDYACWYGQSQSLTPTGGVFAVPPYLPEGSTISCVVSNDHKPMLRVTKEWRIDGKTYTVPQGEGAALSAGYAATLTIGGEAASWGVPFDISEGVPTIGEINVTKPANCTVATTLPDVSGFEPYARSLTEATSESDYWGHHTATIINTVTCRTSNGGGETTTGETPPPTTSVVPQSEVAPPLAEPEVLGVSQEIAAPTVEVMDVTGSAPSANAHTGQGTSPWAYVLLTVGLVLMLGALGIRRRGQA